MATAAPRSLSSPSGSAAAVNPHKRKRPAAMAKTGKGKPGGRLAKMPRRSDEPADRPRRRGKPSDKFLRLLRKRARDYNSDDDDEEKRLEEEEASSSGDDEAAGAVTRFEEGCRAFRVAFSKIMAKKLPDDPLGPILSAHKKLVAAKLAEDVEERKPKGEGRKDKRLAAEKGHVIPTNHLDSKEKELIKIATQGVVRLFNAVSKAQNSRKGLNPSRTKDAKALAKETKQTFLTELKKYPIHQKGQASSNFSKHDSKDEDEPGWAPLRNTYMLGSKLKDWDKMQASDVANKQTETPLDDSSDEE
ncbi:RRP15-like protein isoform X2 [Oryza brachyantha]|uniref:RRP15-like protein isoform X2 n=1 Tax=Oryza brachyantha TaxID=4533 RepID=UPI001ADA303C|nr:RRP15-like protein isoform X2 [Oryza brachyantha]